MRDDDCFVFACTGSLLLSTLIEMIGKSKFGCSADDARDVTSSREPEFDGTCIVSCCLVLHCVFRLSMHPALLPLPVRPPHVTAQHLADR